MLEHTGKLRLNIAFHKTVIIHKTCVHVVVVTAKGEVKLFEFQELHHSPVADLINNRELNIKGIGQLLLTETYVDNSADSLCSICYMPVPFFLPLKVFEERCMGSISLGPLN